MKIKKKSGRGLYRTDRSIRFAHFASSGETKTRQAKCIIGTVVKKKKKKPAIKEKKKYLSRVTIRISIKLRRCCFRVVISNSSKSIVASGGYFIATATPLLRVVCISGCAVVQFDYYLFLTQCNSTLIFRKIVQKRNENCKKIQLKSHNNYLTLKKKN